MNVETFRKLKRGDILNASTTFVMHKYRVVKGYEKSKDGEGRVGIGSLDVQGHVVNRYNLYESECESSCLELDVPKDVCPSVETLLKVFWMFDEHGLIRDDLCFEPEHFMETVIVPHWKKWKKKK